jgi:hypothetical protein
MAGRRRGWPLMVAAVLLSACGKDDQVATPLLGARHPTAGVMRTRLADAIHK